MGISQIPDHIRRAPTEALRAVFSGIGRILLAADRPNPAIVRSQDRTGIATTSSPATAAGQRRGESSRPAEQSRWRSLDQTGNVRLLGADDIYRDDVAEPTDGLLVGDAVPRSGAPALPLAGYDNLSLASIRARLRSLTPDQLKVLADYERKNAERVDVLGMLERRIEKVERGG
jgi:hypothetical protein